MKISTKLGRRIVIGVTFVSYIAFSFITNNKQTILGINTVIWGWGVIVASAFGCALLLAYLAE
jgi:hypothetical protein